MKKFLLSIFSITGEFFLLNQMIFHLDEERLKAFLISLSVAILAAVTVYFYKDKQKKKAPEKKADRN